MIQQSHECADDAAPAAEDGGAAEDDGRDRFQFVSTAGIRFHLSPMRGKKHARDSRRQSGQQIRHPNAALDGNPGISRALRCEQPIAAAIALPMVDRCSSTQKPASAMISSGVCVGNFPINPWPRSSNQCGKCV